MPLLFVYGTLKKGCKNHSVLKALPATYVTDACIQGVLFNLGPFPGYKRDVSISAESAYGRVFGELYSVPDYALKRADRFEGVPTLYTREEVQVNADGVLDMAFVYEVTDDTIESYKAGNRIIPSGVWVEVGHGD